MTDGPGRRSERGSALFVAMMMLVLMGLIGFAALETVTRDQQVASFLNRKSVALYAAEAGIAEAIDNLMNAGAPSVTPGDLADANTYPYGQPSYQLDPTVAAADQIKDLGIGVAEGMNLAAGGGGPTFTVQYYRIRVQGDAPGGSTSRVEVVSGLLTGS